MNFISSYVKRIDCLARKVRLSRAFASRLLDDGIGGVVSALAAVR
jgi:hypothetical protein